jgi:GAF domain-containing protein
VVPIVRAHHEKWDGSGYPNGLRGEEIPIGARILAAVDCLDALAADRQYRRALPLHEAMAKVASEAGVSFDPQVVKILQRRYVELEKFANEQPRQAMPKLSTDIRVERGLAPDAGFAESAVSGPFEASSELIRSGVVAGAREEAKGLSSLIERLGGSINLEDIFSLLAVRVKRLVPHAAMAVYVLRAGVLVPEFVRGENFRLFSTLRIPVGEGLSGWVLQNAKAILNGNPSVEPGYLNDPERFSTLRSALAIPLEGSAGVVGVLALYRESADAFSRDELNALQEFGAELGKIIQKTSAAPISKEPALAAAAHAGGRV